jgi:hypothetical protein
LDEDMPVGDAKAMRWGMDLWTVDGKADPPFDFAQGRLCGDDNKKGYGRSI